MEHELYIQSLVLRQKYAYPDRGQQFYLVFPYRTAHVIRLNPIFVLPDELSDEFGHALGKTRREEIRRRQVVNDGTKRVVVEAPHMSQCPCDELGVLAMEIYAVEEAARLLRVGDVSKLFCVARDLVIGDLVPSCPHRRRCLGQWRGAPWYIREGLEARSEIESFGVLVREVLPALLRDFKDVENRLECEGYGGAVRRPGFRVCACHDG